ncbi:MAG: NnrS family protein, partial [Planctomycetaceae bacterium]|nr:NnrS family protein [Planctomycetaceae bacterium]
MTAHDQGKFAISPDLLLPELFRLHPETRIVFDRHGLRGCGGPLGPCESIRFFARAHGVDEEFLLHELEQAVETPGSQVDGSTTRRFAPEIADTIYRRYFLAGIAVVLTAGASWGAWLLWNIGLNGSFRMVSVHAINAHGEAQIFGWVGLFIMGFAYQAFPRLWQTTLVGPKLAVIAFGLMVAGLVVRTVGITAAEAWRTAAPVALAGGLMQIAAVGVFAGQLLVTFRWSGAVVEAYVGFVVAALGWFLLSSVFSVWHSWHTMTAPNLDALVWRIATYQAPLRDLQIHGLALFMILGVSLRMLPAIYGLPRVAERRAWWLLSVLTGAVVGETIVFLAYRWTGDHLIAAGLVPIWAIMTAAVMVLVLQWRPWRPMPEPDRTSKFVRAAYAWLPVSLVMLLLMPVYNRLVGLGFSHAYFGATRHAITVGFISLMIMGMAAKVVPTLNGIDPRT